MVEIRLGQTNGSYSIGDVTVTINQENFEKSEAFKKVTYTISYPSAFAYVWYNWWTSYNIHNVYIKNRANKTIFSSYVKQNSQVVLEVESYHSKYHPEIPLVLGFKRNDGKYHYPYRLLWSLGEFYGLPRHSFEQDNLKNRLNSDNKRRNKITFKLKGTSENHREEKENSTYEDFVQYKYSVDPDNYFGPYSISTDTLFKREKNIPIDFSTFNNVSNKEHDFITIFYTKNNIALLIQFIQHSVSENKTTYQYFKRKSKDGANWDDISDEVTNSSIDNLKALLQNLYYSINDSIVILANKNEIGTNYPVNLVENTFSGILFSDIQPDLINKITVKKNTKNLDDLKYSCYEHSLTQPTETESPQTTTPDFISNVSGLRVFIGCSTTDNVDLAKSVEIKLHNNNGSERKYLYYDSSSTNEQDTERKNKVYCYFYGEDNVPLMIYGGGCFYKPKSLKEYFTWVQVTQITFTTNHEPIKSELDKINKEFNKIQLETTSAGGYGKIEKTDHEDTLGPMSRIKVTKEQSTDNSFTRIKHTTTNTGPIGKVTYNGDELMVLTEQGDSRDSKTMSTQINNDGYNTVNAYYHSSDTGHTMPLLLGFAKGASESPDMFFKRNDNTDTSNWKRVSHTDELGSDSGLGSKINQINYSIKKSIVIKMLEQTTNCYGLMLVQNGTKSASPQEQRSGSRINVSDDTGCKVAQNYKCYKHSIGSGDTTASEIAGLRFFIDKHEVTFSNNTGNLFIYLINYLQVNVYVYVHEGSQTPLLLRYGEKYYGPTSRDKYFDSWEQKTNITSDQSNLQQKLDEINQNLNVVDISITKPGAKYGIINSGKDPPSNLSQAFNDRVLVKFCVTTNYRKLTHSTINGSQIGHILHQGKPLNGINPDTIQANEVSVYYESCDKKFLHPLLIEVKSKGEPINSSWFYRTSGDELTWKQEQNPTIYDTPSKIGNQLQIIGSIFKLFNITIKVEQNRMNYPTAIYNGICIHTSNKSEDLSLSVDLIGVSDEIKVDKYHTYNHHLTTYFLTNNEHLKSKFDRTDNFPLSLKMTIIDRDLDLVGNDGRLVTLIYKDDRAENKRDVEVYYHEDETQPYEIPLLIKFGSNFFAPKNENLYFSRWDEIVNQNRFTSSNPNLLKQELDSIYNSLNIIDLTKTENYGIPCCSNHAYYHKKGGFSTKRIEVTKFTNQTNYTMYVHRTVNNLKIGTIKNISDLHHFKEHLSLITAQNINEVVVIYNGPANTEPILVLLNKGAKYSNDSSYTHGYYYKNEPTRGDTFAQYTFHSINGCNMMGVLKGEEEVWFNACGPETTKPIATIWKHITSQKMTQFSRSPAAELDTTDCKGQVGNVKQVIKCGGDDLTDASTYAGSESSAEDLDKDGREDKSALNGQSSSGRVDTPEQVPAPPQAPQSNDSLGQTSLRTEEQGDLGAGSNDGQDDRPKGGLGAHGNSAGHDGLERSGDVSSRAKLQEGAQGPSGKQGSMGPTGPVGPQGPRGNDGAPGKEGEPGLKQQESQVPNGHTTITHEDQPQSQHNSGGGGHTRQENGVEASPPGPKGEKGDRGETGERGSESLKADTNSNDIWQPIVDLFNKKPEIFYGSGGGVAGVGVIGGIGTVVYKKCVAVGQ